MDKEIADRERKQQQWGASLSRQIDRDMANKQRADEAAAAEYAKVQQANLSESLRVADAESASRAAAQSELDEQRQSQAEAEEAAAEASERRQERVTSAIVGRHGLVMGIGHAVKAWGLLGLAESEQGEAAMKTIERIEGTVSMLRALSHVVEGSQVIWEQYRDARAAVMAVEQAGTITQAEAAIAAEAETAAITLEATTLEELSTSWAAFTSLVSPASLAMVGLGVALSAVAYAYHEVGEEEEKQKEAIKLINEANEKQIEANARLIESEEALAAAHREVNATLTDLHARASGGGLIGSAGDAASAKAALASLDEQQKELARRKEEIEAERQSSLASSHEQFKARQREFGDNEGMTQVGQNAGVLETLGAGLTNTLTALGMKNGNPQGGSEAAFAADQKAANEKAEAELNEIAKLENENNEARIKYTQALAEAEEKDHEKKLENLQQEMEAADRLHQKAIEAAQKAEDQYKDAVIRFGELKGSEQHRVAKVLDLAKAGKYDQITRKEDIQALQSFGTDEQKNALRDSLFHRSEGLTKGQFDPLRQHAMDAQGRARSRQGRYGGHQGCDRCRRHACAYGWQPRPHRHCARRQSDQGQDRDRPAQAASRYGRAAQAADRKGAAKQARSYHEKQRRPELQIERREDCEHSDGLVLFAL